MKMRCYKCGGDLGDDRIYGLHRKCFVAWFELEKEEEFKDVISKTGSNDPSIGFSDMNSSFFLGKFRKYSAELGKRSYILKVQEKDYMELPYMEFLCNQIAQSLGLETPPFYLINFGEKEPVPTFISKNFINRNKKENLIHIYRFLKKAENYNCENLIRVINEQTAKMHGASRFIELCLFDSMIGNNDRHGRNLGIIEFPNRKELAPFYDNVSYLGIEEENFLSADLSPRGKIETSESDEPSMKDYVREFKRLKYGDRLLSFAGKINVKAIYKLIDGSFICDKRKLAIKKLIDKRLKELSSEL